jgi:hypothetical protein
VLGVLGCIQELTMNRRTFFTACGAGAAAAVLPAVPARRQFSRSFVVHAGALLKITSVSYQQVSDHKWSVTITGEGGGATSDFVFNVRNPPHPRAMSHMIGQEIRGFTTPPDSFSYSTKGQA